MLLKRCFQHFNRCWVLCPCVPRINSPCFLNLSLYSIFLTTLLLLDLTFWYLVLTVLFQSLFNLPFISTPFCQELQFYLSLQCLLHVFTASVLISVISLDQQYFAQEDNVPQGRHPCFCLQRQASLGQTHNFSF